MESGPRQISLYRIEPLQKSSRRGPNRRRSEPHLGGHFLREVNSLTQSIHGSSFGADLHMGFPLNRGSLEDGILTCHWHHARFELTSGCTFDLWDHVLGAANCRPLRKNENAPAPFVRRRWL